MPFRTNACFAPLLGDPETRELFSTEATLHGMLAFEMALTRALGETGAAPEASAEAALEAMESFTPDMAGISEAVERDGLPVPEWARQLKAHAGPDAMPGIHIGATSQDLLDTSLVLSLKQANLLFEERMSALAGLLDGLIERFGERPIMGRTRMQAALPVTVRDRVMLWRGPLNGHRAELQRLRPELEIVQFAGPVGLRDKPEGKADQIADLIARDLGIGRSPASWHANRETMVAYGQFLARLTGSLGKIGQDVALMAQQGVEEVRIAGGGISSAMPHKQNPVLAETLVALARVNAVQSGGLAETLIHEQERSGVAWTMEWLLLPAMVETAGAALRVAVMLAGQIERLGAPDLNASSLK